MIDTQELTTLLKLELALQTRHCRHLEAQQRALINCDRGAFRLLQASYPALTAQLEQQVAARNSILHNDVAHPVTLSDILHELPEGKAAAIGALRDKLRRTMERAQSLCKVNEALIANELKYMAFALDLFVEAGRRADVGYGGRGRIGRRRLLDRSA